MNRFETTKARLAAVVFACLAPTVVTWIYFDALAESPLQAGAYAIGKAIQFAFPLVFVLLLMRRRPSEAGIPKHDPQPHDWSQATSVVFGIAMGLAVAAAMFAIYRFFFSEAVVSNLYHEIKIRTDGFRVRTPLAFMGLGLFYSLFHSFMEEYYFRWFVFGQLRHITRCIPAVVISGLAFMAHHVIVLYHYFGPSLLTALLSLAIASGGFIWAWQYEKSQSLLGAWISHLMVDAGIFAIGYHILFSGVTTG